MEGFGAGTVGGLAGGERMRHVHSQSVLQPAMLNQARQPAEPSNTGSPAQTAQPGADQSAAQSSMRTAVAVAKRQVEHGEVQGVVACKQGDVGVGSGGNLACRRQQRESARQSVSRAAATAAQPKLLLKTSRAMHPPLPSRDNAAH